LPRFFGQKIGEWATNHILPSIAQGFQPKAADFDEFSLRVDGMEHGGDVGEKLAGKKLAHGCCGDCG
jgi:hypothetical protein